jgi:hypothetical protein
MNRSWSLAELVACALASAFGGLLTDDWIGAAAVATLWLVWKYMRDQNGLPIVAMALTFQWMQVTIGIWYVALTGRRLDAMTLSDYRPMVLIGLGCVLALTGGLSAGWRIAAQWHVHRTPQHTQLRVTWPMLIALYVASLSVQGVLHEIAFDYPSLTQAILAFRFAHLAALFIVLRRLTFPIVRVPFVAAIVALEIVLGLTQYFAGFRDPLIMVVVAMFEVFDRRRLQHWLVVTAAAVVMIVVSVMWIGVRGAYRAEIDADVFARPGASRMDTMNALTHDWMRESREDMLTDLDMLIDRLWVIYYPALAVSRVPSVLPHTNGSMLAATLEHLTSPRIFFPSKADLQSDSELVRKYSGVNVAGEEQNTSIAFGYAAEMFIDFGVPLMFLPVFGFAFLMGLAYEELRVRIHHDELRRGLLAVIFWLSLYLFERSLAKTMGLAGTLLVYLACPALFIDYYLSRGDAAPAPAPDDDGMSEQERERAAILSAWHSR